MQQSPAPAATTVAGLSPLVVFTMTTFLSALLLFSIQPMFAKMVLPILGGSPSVWAVALAFFQGALLAGYLYAHALIRFLPAKQTGLVHLAFCLFAFVFLPFGLPDAWAEPPTGDVYLWQLGLFSVAIGIPFMAVAANAPLLQAWFARTGHAQSADPYFLYAASNLGSLIALLGYPLILEPLFGLTALSGYWMIGFALLIAALALAFTYVWRRGQDEQSDAISPEPEKTVTTSAITIADRLTWIGLALVPSSLLTAYTTHVATDVASAPLIWVVPLALYLLTFVFVFRERAWIPMPVLLPIQLVAVFLTLLQMSQKWHESWFLTSALGVVAFFSSALVAHRTLYEARPPAKYLTAFYLWMSFGGVLGGLFAALVAPKLFSEVYEYPLLLALALACRPGVVSTLQGRWMEDAKALAALTIGGVMLTAAAAYISAKMGWTFRDYGVAPVLVLVFGLALLAFWTKPLRQTIVALLIVGVLAFLPSGVHRGEAERSYFGVYRVIQSDDGQYNVLQHGTTLHGAQRIKDENGNPVDDTSPVTYYYPRSPMAYVVHGVRNSLQVPPSEAQIGVVGLGAGALACHSNAKETWRFYEIDPVVVRIAKSDSFTYLKKCQPNAKMIVGDARLTLGKEADQFFDLLIVDAFSSDAVPMHLLTREALQMYAAKLKPDGVGMLHISNRYLDLEAVLHATFEQIDGVKAFAIEDRKPTVGYAFTGSTVVVFSKDTHRAHSFLRIRGSRTLRYGALNPWSDDSSEILGPFLSKLGLWRR
jgi:spermidine synthase